MPPLLCQGLGIALLASSAVAGAATAARSHTDVETRLARLLPTLSVEQLVAQTLHLWTTESMEKILAKYGKTGAGASYIAHPTGNSTCDSDPACNLASRLAANWALMKSCGIPLTFVAETLHSPWISQGMVMPMPVTMGATWWVVAHFPLDPRSCCLLPSYVVHCAHTQLRRSGTPRSSPKRAGRSQPRQRPAA